MFKVKVIEPVENYVIFVEYGVTYEEAIKNAMFVAENDGFVINYLEYEVEELVDELKI